MTAKEKKPPEPTDSDRLDIAETALKLRLGIDLSEFDPVEVKQARAKAAVDAAEAIAKIEADAAEKIGKPLTDAQRVERVFAILKSQGHDLDQELVS